MKYEKSIFSFKEFFLYCERIETTFNLIEDNNRGGIRMKNFEEVYLFSLKNKEEIALITPISHRVDYFYEIVNTAH
ncbi:hypothetical protein SAMN05444280_1349 [Tangfeifania diversioriginum]|uniref:Uncharacterized protein n=1 Tax=Tangfeifania diversioriginum TaxID=1168035 RepID=A0A1M6MLU1_9BACT|nr:hypothetical protein [Tangfeifania diversioriginum]SHJ84451.1 hypothetical protein SAMN05444280_1349 [Tangfeifania diversioriginum]